MTSYHHRFLAGEHEQVWAELGTLTAVPANLTDDVTAVADETMRRVAVHVRRLGAALQELGLVPARTLLCPPTGEELADLPRLDEEIGGLPAALSACLRHVGLVMFTGDCPVLGITYEDFEPEDTPLPDPLVIPGAEWLRQDWDDHRDAYGDPGPFHFEFSPDDLTKANISGLSYSIDLPSTVADPLLTGVTWRTGPITLVEYLRTSIAWGGLPGWSTAPDDAPAELDRLRVVPDF
ncbi:hypothetical protein AB0K00_43165 [Dactylosporangium sp. NPDC049525]|uniref:hypothetical protein n=1 Tax=Dactylosporangium sp. NPDC049525 TaxID=3154730 RepID=UPI00343C717D